MRITTLEIENFRAIERVEIDAHSTMIVIAGPNGCGKSCVLDAIRFIKSAYGGYDPNEWNQWLGEFQINRQQDPWEMKKILRDKEKAARIAITLELHPKEREYLRENEQALAEEIAVTRVNPGLSYREWRHRIRILGEQQYAILQQIATLTKNFVALMRAELQKPHHSGAVTIHQDGQAERVENLALQSIWRIYEPQQVGLVDYHGSHRHYAREQVGGVNLNLKTQEEQQKQSTLYNYANKYANIKTQMATEFVLQTLREKGGDSRREPLSDTLKELFRRFFPGKHFEGVKTNDKGELEFAVTVGGENKHDINDLSSGEKEILFGYLRLRNSAQRQSIILLDEPELHLNPKLIRGLPQFYQKHIGEVLDNQIWTVTHSDAFLREAIGSPGTKVYHMKEVNREEAGASQVKEIKREEESEEAVLEMIGDILIARILADNSGNYSGFDAVCAASSGNPQNLLSICSCIFATAISERSDAGGDAGLTHISGEMQNRAIVRWSKDYEEQNPYPGSRVFCRSLVRLVRNSNDRTRSIGFACSPDDPDLFTSEYLPDDVGELVKPAFSAGFIRNSHGDRVSLFDVPSEFYLNRGLLPREGLDLHLPVSPARAIDSRFIKSSARESVFRNAGNQAADPPGSISAFLSTSFAPRLDQQRSDIKQALQREQVQCIDLGDAPGDQFLFTSIRKAIDAADVTILDATMLRPYTMLEIGMCAGGTNPKSVICVVNDEDKDDALAALPGYMKHLPVLRFSFASERLARLAADGHGDR